MPSLQEESVTYVINDACIGELDGSCVEVCPVDCIYQGLTKRYIHPRECVDCGACLSTCPVDAILEPDEIDDDPASFEDNARFFDELLPGRAEPLGEPGGAGPLGPVGADTPRVAAHTKAN
jgi:NAD-dependent dihydropyrimidine dehydrogenase PreA subunit